MLRSTSLCLSKHCWMFKCTRCAVEQPIDNYHKRSTVSRGHDSWCKSCKSEYRKDYFNRNKDKEVLRSRAKAWKYQGFEFTHEQHEEMLKSQDNKCAICGEETKLHVDHCHKTNKVRGLLCPPCNKGLGHFKDNSQLLTNARNYLLND